MKEISIIGNLGANAVRRTAADGRELMTFNVAVNVKNLPPVWFNCIGSFREKLFPFLVKGQGVCVVGDLSAGVYNGTPDLQVNIDKIELIGAAPEESSQQTNEGK
jgi:hypothetical protein